MGQWFEKYDCFDNDDKSYSHCDKNFDGCEKDFDRKDCGYRHHDKKCWVETTVNKKFCCEKKPVRNNCNICDLINKISRCCCSKRYNECGYQDKHNNCDWDC